jgi:hypothetical protein
MTTRLFWPALVTAFCVTACNRDGDAQNVIDELAALDKGVVNTLEKSPNEVGVAQAEALVNAKNASLHARVLDLTTGARLSAAASMAMSHACVKNDQSAKIALDYLHNAILNTNPELRKRGDALGAALCEICETPSYSTRCATFRPHP